jgi:hypothetical protein
MRTDSANLYIQVSKEAATLNTPYHGILKSSDEGKTWESICGPSNGFLTDFYVDSNGEIWAGGINEINGFYTALYHNSTGKANSPRLLIEPANKLRTISCYSGDVVSGMLYYPIENYYEVIDSISFVVNHSKALSYSRDSAAFGWSVIRRELSDTSVRFTLSRTDPTSIVSNSPLLKVFYQSYITNDDNATINLDEVAFNQDVPQRACMLIDLKNTDTLHVNFIDKCGDSLIRNFLRVGKILSTMSIYPNPANDYLTVDLKSTTMDEAQIDIIDPMGKVSLTQRIVLRDGANHLPINIKELSAGMYNIRIRTNSDMIFRGFIKRD